MIDPKNGGKAIVIIAFIVLLAYWYIKDKGLLEQ